MSSNGYFDEEPIIVVPRNLPKDYSIDDQKHPDLVQNELKELILNQQIDFVVVEGNRRMATAKILTSQDYRTKLNITHPTFAAPKNPKIVEDLRTIPAIVYTDRAKVSPYLGVRHISGLLKWDAFAKAAYIAQNIQDEVLKGNSYAASISEVQSRIPDRSDVIRKQYLCYCVLMRAEQALQFDVSNIKDRFSLLTVALNSPSIRTYIGAPSYREADFDVDIVPQDKLENLERVLTWIYGNGDTDPILTDSRLITSRLAPVLASDTATEYLIDNQNLNDAYERSDGERNYILKKLSNAERDLIFATKYVEKYGTDESYQQLVENCYKLISELRDQLV